MPIWHKFYAPLNLQTGPYVLVSTTSGLKFVTRAVVQGRLPHLKSINLSSMIKTYTYNLHSTIFQAIAIFVYNQGLYDFGF
jgi:hypothetical protein